MDRRHAGHTGADAPVRRRAAHADRPALAPGRLVSGIAAAVAALVAVGLGVTACLDTLGSSGSTPTSAQSITATPSPDRAADSPAPPP